MSRCHTANDNAIINRQHACAAWAELWPQDPGRAGFASGSEITNVLEAKPTEVVRLQPCELVPMHSQIREPSLRLATRAPAN